MKLMWKGGKPPDVPNIDRAQQYVDSEVLRRCDPFVPKDTGELIRSGIRET